jgi:hypothetical protein
VDYVTSGDPVERIGGKLQLTLAEIFGGCAQISDAENDIKFFLHIICAFFRICSFSFLCLRVFRHKIRQKSHPSRCVLISGR